MDITIEEAPKPPEVSNEEEGNIEMDDDED